MAVEEFEGKVGGGGKEGRRRWWAMRGIIVGVGSEDSSGDWRVDEGTGDGDRGSSNPEAKELAADLSVPGRAFFGRQFPGGWM